MGLKWGRRCRPLSSHDPPFTPPPWGGGREWNLNDSGARENGGQRLGKAMGRYKILSPWRSLPDAGGGEGLHRGRQGLKK